MKTKKAKYALLSVALAASLAFAAFVPALTGCDPKENEEPIDAPEFEIEKIVDFADGANRDVIFETDGYGNGSVFNVEWNTENVTYEDGLAKMSISEVPETATSSYPYYGAELRTSMWYHYGFYSVSMKPSKDSGTASTFFTYTGPYGEYDEEGNLHPWDEIDIEFLGKDTTKVQFNYYVNGTGGHEYMYDLGFDASEDYHTYGFLWEEDAITWYVDGEPVYQVTSEDEKPKTEGLPSTPGRIMLNHWCGTEDAEAWMGEYTGYETSVEYQWVGTTSEAIEPITTPPGQDNPDEPIGDVSFTAGEEIALAFENATESAPYTIEASEDGKTVDVTYSELGKNYDNIVAAVDGQDEGKNAFALTVKNNGEKDVNIRVDVRDSVNIVSDSTGATYNDGTPRHSCLNTVGLSREAGTEEWASAPADTEWGGSFFTVPAGKTSELVVVYDPTHFVCGNIVKDGEFSVSDITIFIDSHVDNGPFTGDVTISGMNFGSATVGETEEPEEPALEAIITEGKTYQVNPIASEETTALTLSSTAYTVKAAEDNKSADITYENMAGNSYQIVQIKDKNMTADGDNVFALKVKNNGTATVNFRLNVLKDGGANLNVGATQDGVGVRTDMEWGGSFFTVEAGETIDAVVYFSGPASEFQFMIDSSIGSEDVHSGNVTVSEYRIGAATPAEVA